MYNTIGFIEKVEGVLGFMVVMNLYLIIIFEIR